EELPRHTGVVVLPRVGDGLGVARAEGAGERGELDELGAPPGDREDVHAACGMRAESNAPPAAVPSATSAGPTQTSARRRRVGAILALYLRTAHANGRPSAPPLPRRPRRPPPRRARPRPRRRRDGDRPRRP